MTDILYINIGWMNDYKGPVSGDKTTGNHGYLKKHAHGHECFNFEPLDGVCYGYAPGGKGANISRLGASSSDEQVDNILVVWIARSPFDGMAYIVGWYENATVFRKPQYDLEDERELHGYSYLYAVLTAEENAHLVPAEDRVFTIPSSRTEKHGFGQSAYWYADKRPDIVAATKEYIFNGKAPSLPGGKRGGPRNNNPELRKQVETAAVDLAIKHYEDLGFTVISREVEGVGWDLEADNGKIELFIEVKGLSGKNVVVEFTPNEYSQMNKFHKKYVIFVVSEALTNPRKYVFRCYRKGLWVDGADNVLKLRERVSAEGRCR